MIALAALTVEQLIAEQYLQSGVALYFPDRFTVEDAEAQFEALVQAGKLERVVQVFCPCCGGCIHACNMLTPDAEASLRRQLCSLCEQVVFDEDEDDGLDVRVHYVLQTPWRAELSRRPKDADSQKLRDGILALIEAHAELFPDFKRTLWELGLGECVSHHDRRLCATFDKHPDAQGWVYDHGWKRSPLPLRLKAPVRTLASNIYAGEACAEPAITDVLKSLSDKLAGPGDYRGKNPIHVVLAIVRFSEDNAGLGVDQTIGYAWVNCALAAYEAL